MFFCTSNGWCLTRSFPKESGTVRTKKKRKHLHVFSSTHKSTVRRDVPSASSIHNSSFTRATRSYHAHVCNTSSTPSVPCTHCIEPSNENQSEPRTRWLRIRFSHEDETLNSSRRIMDGASGFLVRYAFDPSRSEEQRRRVEFESKDRDPLPLKRNTFDFSFGRGSTGCYVSSSFPKSSSKVLFE